MSSELGNRRIDSRGENEGHATMMESREKGLEEVVVLGDVVAQNEGQSDRSFVPSLRKRGQ